MRDHEIKADITHQPPGFVFETGQLAGGLRLDLGHSRANLRCLLFQVHDLGLPALDFALRLLLIGLDEHRRGHKERHPQGRPRPG